MVSLDLRHCVHELTFHQLNPMRRRRKCAPLSRAVMVDRYSRKRYVGRFFAYAGLIPDRVEYSC